MRTYTAIRIAAALPLLFAFGNASAQQSLTTLATTASPGILLVNPVTNKLFVVGTNNSVDVFDGATHARTTLFPPSAFLPQAAAINPVTNKVYIGYVTAGIGITELDGATNTMTTLDPGPGPTGGKATKAIVVNPVTNKVYAAREADNEVTVIDAANSNAITRVTIAGGPRRLALNAVANRVYALGPTATLTEINGATNVPSSITVGAAALTTLAVNPVTDKVYVANASQVFEVDGPTRVVTPITTVAGIPSLVAIAINPATNKVYVSNNAPPYNVTVIDGATRAVDATVSVSAGSTTPVVDSVSNRVFVTNEGSNTPGVDVIDGATNTTLTTVPYANGSFYSVAVNPVTGRVYLADFGNDKIQVVDRSTYASTAGPFGSAAAVNPVTGKIYVAHLDTDSLRVLDAATNAVLATPALGITNPHDVAVDPVLNKVYVLGQLGGFAVINGATDTVLTAPGNNIGGGGSRNIAVNPITHKVYVSMWGNSEMKVIDGVTHATLATLPIPKKPNPPGADQSAFPEQIAVNMETNRIFVVNPNTDNVTVIDGATDTIVKHIQLAVGSQPKWVDVNPVTNRIYVGNYGVGGPTGQTLSEILGSTIDNPSPTVNTYPISDQVWGVAVNPVTNKVFGTRSFGGAFVLDGATSVVTMIDFTQGMRFVAVDPVRNKVYFTDQDSNSLTIMDGTTHAFIETTTTANAQTPVINPVTGKFSVHSRWGAGNVAIAIVDPAPTTFTKHQPSAGLVIGTSGSTSQASPNLNVTVGGAYTPTDPAVQKLYFRKGDSTGTHSTATGTGPYTAAIPALPLSSKGLNYVSLFALDAMTATAMSTESAEKFGASPTVTGAPKVFAFVYTGPPEITTASLPGVNFGATYNQTLKTFGGLGTIVHTVAGPPLPNGLSISSAGAITGTATAAGTFNFTVTATDSLGTIGTKALSITVAAGVLTLNPTTTLTFAGTVVVGSTTAASSVTVTNTGDLSLTVGTPTITGTNAADFTLSSNNCTTLAAAATCTLQFTFTPSATGARVATVTVPNNGGGTTDNVVGLAGTGADTTPNAFTFTDVTGVARNSVQTSALVTITGIDAPAPISVLNGSYSVGCTATYITSASTITNNQTVCVRHTAAPTHLATTNTILNVGGVTDTFSSTTLAGFTLTASSTGTGSGTIAGTGIACPGDCTETFDPATATSVTASASGGSLFTSWSGCDSVVGAQCNVTMGAAKAVVATFTLQDTTPDTFSFSDVTAVARNSVQTSNSVTIQGINAPAAISVTGGSYSIGCNGTFVTAASTISTGQTVCVRHTAAATNSAATNTTLTVGGVSDTFTSTTLPGFTLTTALSGTGTGTVTGTGIACPGDCSELFDLGTSVTLTATPSGSNALAWSNCPSVLSNQCTVVVTADQTVTAKFTVTSSFTLALEGWQQQPYAITAATGSGTAVFNPVTHELTLSLTYTGLESAETMAHIHGPAARGANAPVLEILPAVGSPKNAVVTLFPDWEVMLLAGQLYINIHTTNRPDGELRAQIDNVGATALRALTVAKAGAGSGTVTGTTEAGTVVNCGPDCGESIPNGEQVVLTATPTAGTSTFFGWSGACTGTGACNVTMDAAKSVTATFNAVTPDTPGASVTPGSLAFGGQSMSTTSPAKVVTVTNTGTATLTVNSVSIDNAQFAQTNNCASVAPNATCTVNVTFSPATVTGALNSTAPVTGQLSIASNASGSPHTVSLTGSAEKSLVTHYYRSILRRAPDAGGLAFWQSEAARMAPLGVNVNEAWFSMAQSFYSSGEYTALNRDDTGYITDLYNTFFNRAPDSGGLAFWLGNLAGGMPREVALAEFMFSAEFRNFAQAIFGNTAARAEVNTVVDFYRGLLARLPDDGGFAFWLAKFRTAQCTQPPSAAAAAITAQVEAISQAYTDSGEYAARGRSSAQFVGDLYNAFLRRGGDLGGVQYWIGQVTSGALTRDALRVLFKGSPEFQARVQAIIAQGCLGN